MAWNGNFGVEYGRCHNGMEDFNNGTEDNLPHFHTNSILDFVHCIYRIKIQRRIAIGWQAFGRANSVLTRKLPISFKRKVYYQSEVESSRTSLASRTHFQVLGLEASSPWPRSLRSSVEDSTIFWTVEILLENATNLAENLQKPFCFPQLEHRLSQAGPPPNWNLTNDKNVTKKPIGSSVSVSF